MNGKNFINKNEVLKSVGIIDDCVRKEEDLLKKMIAEKCAKIVTIDSKTP